MIHHNTTNTTIESTTTTPARKRSAGGVAFALAAGLLLSACGGSTPSKDDFIAEVRTTLGADLASGEGVDIDADALATVVDDFLGCTYDAIKHSPDLLNQMMRDPSFSTATTDTGSEQQEELNRLTADCLTELNSAATEVPSGEE